MFTVVIPVYNHERYLERAIGSALRSPLVTEILVVDDGSTDQSAAVLSQFSRAFGSRVSNFTIEGEGNRGAHNRLNQLCGKARSEFIAVLNSDDEFVPG